MRFAKIGLNSRVIDILEVAASDCQDADTNFDEAIGIQFLNNLISWPLWIAMTDARHGDKHSYEWDESINCFKPEKLYASWTFNSTSGDYEPPVAYPSDYFPTNGSVKYRWNESGQSWDASGE